MTERSLTQDRVEAIKRDWERAYVTPGFGQEGDDPRAFEQPAHPPKPDDLATEVIRELEGYNGDDFNPEYLLSLARASLRREDA